MPLYRFTDPACLHWGSAKIDKCQTKRKVNLKDLVGGGLLNHLFFSSIEKTFELEFGDVPSFYR